MSHITWSYGITTLPQRANNLLAQTVKSLSKAGFDEPIIFMDGMPAEDQSPKLENIAGAVVRWPPLGNLGNWMSALFGVYLANPDAKRYAVFEDDLIACSNLRAYLEQYRFPHGTGYLNLLTHDENLVLAGPQEGWHLSNQCGRGAVALVFDNQTVMKLLTSLSFIQRPKGKGSRSPDGMVLQILQGMEYKEYIHNPSLVQHTGGGQSTLGHRYGAMKAWLGEDYNPLTLISKKQDGASVT